MSKPPVTLYHNPKCSNSRRALEVLSAASVPLKVVKYLENPPSREEILELLKNLGENSPELVRTQEKVYAESGLTAESDAEAIADALTRFPVLMQRPVCVQEDRVIVARPGERAKEILSDFEDKSKDNAFDGRR